MSKQLSQRIDDYAHGGRGPEIVQRDCPHREQARAAYEALVPVPGVRVEGEKSTVWFPQNVFVCATCGALLPGWEPTSGVVLMATHHTVS